MLEASYKFIDEASPIFNSESVFFNNFNIKHDFFKNTILKIGNEICAKINTIYKTHSHLSFAGAGSCQRSKYKEHVQFDDVCVRFLHIQSGLNFFVTLKTKLARMFLIRLLATSLIDDSHELLFSSTEKGIFSFIVTRMLFDLKNAFKDLFPDIKLIGIYHSQDSMFYQDDSSPFGLYHLNLTFASNTYPVMIAIPKSMMKADTANGIDQKRLFARCGHLSSPLLFPLRMIDVTAFTFATMSFGDLILFNDSENKIIDAALSGPMRANWRQMRIFGKLEQKNGRYFFTIDRDHFLEHTEDEAMDALDIIDAKDDSTLGPGPLPSLKKFSDITENTRIRISIELARLHMTLKELCQIRNGEILDLQRMIDDPLEMVVEGKVIGHCQPVQIDGRLGIRVLDIAGEN